MRGQMKLISKKAYSCTHFIQHEFSLEEAPVVVLDPSLSLLDVSLFLDCCLNLLLLLFYRRFRRSRSTPMTHGIRREEKDLRP
jgi:hypothetical protein